MRLVKVCSACRIEKELSEFYKMKDKLQANCKPCAKAAVKEWRKSNANHFRKYRTAYQDKRKSETKVYNREYKKKRYSEDVDFRIRCLLRTRIRNAVKEKKVGSAIEDLGCTIQDLCTHLESKFLPGMDWENFGDWHIDHIKPLSSFDLSVRKEFLEACRFTNLQPLWAEENIRKGMKV